MTAEIALLNRRGLAFAADSAMTISNGSSEKIYNSAEKIFELSRTVPMGLMLYNNMEFVGVPIDVLARKFRMECDERFVSCESVCKKFLAFLSCFKRTVGDEQGYLRSVLSEELQEIAREQRSIFQRDFSRAVHNDPQNLGNFESIMENGLKEIIQKHTSTHEKRPLKGYLENVGLSEFIDRYKAAIDTEIRLHLKGFANNESIKNSLYQWAFSAVKSEVFSDSLTGLVFGGFGADELFPSLHAIEIDGIFHDELKCKVTRTVDIDRYGERAAIVPFAQKEMVERFLYGIDADLESTLIEFVHRSTDRAVEKLGKVVDLKAQGIDATSYSGDVSKLLVRLKEKSRDETLDMVDFMPKQELAYTAEAFVTLTSIKRKVSAQQETVGGPVDVAMITRNEGFIWIKRKHYFNEELNPGYRIRTFEREKGDPNVRTPKTRSRVGRGAPSATNGKEAAEPPARPK
jgi:hypothetical protein